MLYCLTEILPSLTHPFMLIPVTMLAHYNFKLIVRDHIYILVGNSIISRYQNLVNFAVQTRMRLMVFIATILINSDSLKPLIGHLPVFLSENLWWGGGENWDNLM